MKTPSMKMPTIGLGMIVHPRDAHLLPPFFARHETAFDAVSIVLDSEEDTREVEGLIVQRFENRPQRLRWGSRPLGQDFATQRNVCAALNPCDWLFMLDADERLHARFLKLLKPVLVEVLRKNPKARVLGLARRNILDGKATEVWPDWQYRLVKRGVRWRNTHPHMNAKPGCHELPRELYDAPSTVSVLNNALIIHEKTTERQVEQNLFYEFIA